MADAVAPKDHVMPRGIIGITLDAGLLPQPPIEGVVTAVSVGHAATVLWQNGVLATGMDVTDGDSSPLLKVAAPSVSTLFGKVVQLTGKNPEFSGPVIQVLGIELDPKNNAGAFTDCVVVKSRGPSQSYFIATAANVSVIN